MIKNIKLTKTKEIQFIDNEDRKILTKEEVNSLLEEFRKKLGKPSELMEKWKNNDNCLENLIMKELNMEYIGCQTSSDYTELDIPYIYIPTVKEILKEIKECHEENTTKFIATNSFLVIDFENDCIGIDFYYMFKEDDCGGTYIEFR